MTDITNIPLDKLTPGKATSQTILPPALNRRSIGFSPASRSGRATRPLVPLARRGRVGAIEASRLKRGMRPDRRLSACRTSVTTQRTMGCPGWPAVQWQRGF